MIPPWATLDGNDRAMLGATVAFLKKRLAEPDTIEWALGLKPDQRVERMALAKLLNGPEGSALDQPWASAWRLIEESWSQVAIEEDPSTAIYDIRERLRHGDRSGAVVSAIVNLVAPRLKVEPIRPTRWQLQKKPRRPSAVNHLLSARLTSGDLINPNVLELAQLKETPFLSALANALEAAVNHGLDIARRIGWDGESQPGRLGSLFRVSYTRPAQRADEEDEPDAYHHGIAPAVKLLHAVVEHIAELDPGAALPVVQRWRLRPSPIHTRLWAAAALNSCLVSAEDVGAFLIELDDRQFWNLHEFSEIAELRALRFAELDRDIKDVIAARLRKLPPRNQWPRKADAAQVKSARLYWAVRELKRIEIAGGDLPPDARSWLEDRIGLFGKLAEMKIDDGFPEAPRVPYNRPEPDDQYGALQGRTRLRVLENDLSSDDPDIWYRGPAKRADDWLRQPRSAILVLGDLESIENGGDKFPSVWKFFGQAHAPEPPETGDDPQHDLHGEAERVLRLLEKLSDGTLSAAIEGISHWLMSWREQVIASPSGSRVWLRIWPIAVEATNAGGQPEEDTGLSVFPNAADLDQEPKELDTLNPPSGKLVSVFLRACPSLNEVPEPFAAGSNLRQMRDAVVGATGRSGLIARHRMIEFLRCFLRSDRDWTQEHLIAPLLADDDASRDLWDAIARRLIHSTDVLEIIGKEMANRATNRRIRRATRQNLVVCLVVESLQAFRKAREPAVPNPRIQQMLRSLDDEVRVTAAGAIRRFVREISQETTNNQTPTAAELFRSTAAPFLQHVWPQERSLATPGVSGALAKLPATSGEIFVEAFEATKRFLVPFDCWSMLDYGLHGKDGGEGKLSIINDKAKAEALLRLLDLTVGTSEAAVIPYGLTDALDRIRSVAESLVDSPEFRRLSTAARR